MALDLQNKAGLTPAGAELAVGDVQQQQPRIFFINLEEALAIDKMKSQRREARAFMPIRDQILVYPCDKDDMTETGTLFLPDSAQERQSEGIAIAVGRGRLDANNVFIPTEVRPGDRVLFGKYAGIEHKLRGKTVRIMQEDEILGVIR